MADESTVKSAKGPNDEVLRLLVTDAVVSWVFPLSVGEILVGRGPECHLRLADSMASRTHVTVRVDEERSVFVKDLGSSNGSTLNGAPLRGEAPLAPGDMLRIGQCTIYLYLGNPADGRRVMSMAELRRRLVLEIERAVRNDSPCAMFEVRMEAVSAKALDAVVGVLRPADSVSELSHTRVLVLLPDLPLDAVQVPAQRILQRLESVGVRASLGVATAPLDAAEADALIESARVAADHATPGAVAFPAERLRKIEAGGDHVLVGDQEMARGYAMLERLAQTEIAVLITGETGVGKEFAARLVHEKSRRATGPFVTVNCAAIAPGVAEAELFGSARGAFTGAMQSRAGYVESADGGTLFLDEVGELTATVQASLLRVLETNKVLRVGEVTPRAVNVRLVAATHRDLERDVKAGRFREDLYFRIVGAQVLFPPLRHRRVEILPLARAFLRDASGDKSPPGLTTEVQGRLLQYAWPGNVRELRSAMRFVAGTCAGPVVRPEHLPARILESADAGAESTAFRPVADEVRELEARRIAEALRASGWNKTRAAGLIGMPIRTLTEKMKQYGIVRDDPRAPR